MKPDLILSHYFSRPNWRSCTSMYKILNALVNYRALLDDPSGKEVIQIIAGLPEFPSFRLFWSMLDETQRTSLLSLGHLPIGNYLFAVYRSYNIFRLSPAPIVRLCFTKANYDDKLWEQYAMQFWYLSNRPNFVEIHGNPTTPLTLDDVGNFRQARMTRHLDLLVKAL
jgi:hypothetical protein